MDFWLGRLNPPDTLNIGIVLLARALPFYMNENDAIALLEKYVDELPQITLSDRLNSANRAEIARVIRIVVTQVYACDGYQDDPELSSSKLGQL